MITADIRDINAIESESGIIATLIHHPDYVFRSEQLKPEHFTRASNRDIYKAIDELAKRGIQTVDAYNIMEVMDKGSEVKLEQIQDLIEASELIVRNSVEEYQLAVSNVIDAAFRRGVYVKLKECEALCLSGESADLGQEIYRVIDDVMLGFSVNNSIPQFKEVVDELWQEIEDRQSGANGGMDFRFPTLNQYVTLEKGELIVVGALMKAGKSMFLMNCAADLLKADKAVFYIDSELNSRMWLTRLMAHMTGIDYQRVKSGNYTSEERQLIYDTKEYLKTRKLVHLYMPFFDIEGIYAATKKVNHVMPIDVLVIDYFKSGDSIDAYANYAQLGKLVDMVKNQLAGDMGLAALAAAQAASGGTKLADSAKIARNASTILMLVDKTSQEILDDGTECGNKKLIVSLNRNGMQHAPEEYIDLAFDGNKIQFTEAKQHVKQEAF